MDLIIVWEANDQYTPIEVKAYQSFVEEGGSLLLMAGALWL